MIHLKRFDCNLRKLPKRMENSPRIQIAGHYYTFSGVVSHRGTNLLSGHYVAYTKTSADARVEDVTNAEGYQLFYKKSH